MELLILCIVIVCLQAALMIVSERYYHGEKEAWRLERKELLDRLMARDYGHYVQGRIAQEEAKAPAPSEEQIRKYMAANGMEQGIPVD